MTLRRRRFLSAGLAAAGVIALTPAIAAATEVVVEATLGAKQVQVGEAVYLQVSVETDGRSIGDPEFPGLTDVEIEATGTSSGFSASFGTNAQAVRRSTRTYTYVLAPLTPGSHEIPVEVEVDGKRYRPATTPKLEATGAAAAPTVEIGKAGDTPDDPQQQVIVWPVVDHATAYVGQQLVYELQIWERSAGNLSISAAPTFKDFWSEDLDVPQNNRRLPKRAIGNVPYRVHQTMRRALFPQKAGTLVIGGPKVQLQDSVDFFFGPRRPTRPPQTFVGRSLAIEVLPLPAEGQPADFPANNVGRYALKAEVDRQTLRQGEAVRLTVTVSGVGNIALVELGAWPTLAGARSYDPKPQAPTLQTNGTQLQGERSTTMLVVAEQAGSLEIPAIELPYFDPDARAYRVAKSEPITLSVEANPDFAAAGSEDGGDAAEATTARPGGGDQELLAPPLAGETLARVSPRETWLTPQRWWLGILASPGLLGLGWVGARLRRRFGPTDIARARAQRLGRQRRLLTEAAAVVESGEGFHLKLADALQAAALSRAGPDGVGLTRDRLMQLLATRGVDSGDIDRLRALLDSCDAARFGAGAGDADSRRSQLEQARAMLADKTWRSA